jgi:HSP20 family molecular chaperone IbpA
MSNPPVRAFLDRELMNALNEISAAPHQRPINASLLSVRGRSCAGYCQIPSDNWYRKKIDLPDVSKEDVRIAVSDGAITISGERKLDWKDQSKNAIRVESIYGAFTRSFVLPDYVEVKGINAEAKDGVLRVHIPKAKAKKLEPLAIAVH